MTVVFLPVVAVMVTVPEREPAYCGVTVTVSFSDFSLP